jgi:hypothetical protein
MHLSLVMDFWNLKIWTGLLNRLLINWKNHIKFHSKYFLVTKYALKNEITKLDVKPFFFGWMLNVFMIKLQNRIKCNLIMETTFQFSLVWDPKPHYLFVGGLCSQMYSLSNNHVAKYKITLANTRVANVFYHKFSQSS